MRQAIDGTGADSTAAVKAYLLEHDEVLAQELYELVFPLRLPSIIAGGSALGPFSLPVPLGPGESALALMTTVGTAVPVGGGGSLVSVDATSGEIDRWASAPLGDLLGPGYLVWSDLSALPIPQSAVTKIYAVGIVDFNGELGVQYFQGSTDNGATWPAGLTMVVSGGIVSGQVAALVASGSAAQVLDLTQVQLRMKNEASLSVSLTPPGDVMKALAVGVVIYYGGGSPTGLVTRKMYFCDASSPLTYRGQIYTPANIKNNGFKSKIGIDVDSLQLDWNFRGDEPMVTDPVDGHTILTMLQAFKEGLWAGAWVKWRRTYMPTFGDCDTLGAVSMFRGRIGPVDVDRLKAKITVNSVTELFNRQIPAQLIEQNNRALQVGPGLPPDLDPDPSSWTFFECVDGHGGNVQKIVANQVAPTAGVVYAPGTFDLGYLWFQASPLEYFIAQVQHYEVIGGYNVFYLFRPLYVDPHSYPLTFAAFIPVPKDQTLSGVSGLDLPGFPHVPLPEQAV